MTIYVGAIARLRTAFLPILVLCLMVFAAGAEAQSGGTLSGRVTSANGAPVAGATVAIVDSLGRRRLTTTDEAGRYRIAGLSAGNYFIEVTTTLDEGAIVFTALQAGAARDVPIRLTPAGVRPRTRIVVSGTPTPRASTDFIQPVEVIERREIDRRRADTLGEVLNNLPNVGSTSFGAGASRPIIRGLQGPRVRILNSGIDTFDVSTTSDDHPVAIDPIIAERIELIRGPATLMYGNNAIGGVINVLSGRIIRTRPDRPISGSFEGGYATGSQQPEGRGKLQFGKGPIWIHLDGFLRDANAYRIPGEPGKQANSHVQSRGGAAGVSFVGEDGYIGFVFSAFRRQFGVPSPEKAESGVTLDVDQVRFDIEGAYRADFWIFKGIKGRWGYIDYEHDEGTPKEVKLTFRNEGYEGRIELPHRKIGPFEGAIGFQIQHSRFQATGEEESFVQPTRTTSYGFFIFEEMKQGSFTHQFGFRVEPVRVRPTLEGFSTRNFVPLSGAVGSVWRFRPGYSAGLNVSVTQRAPSAQELFSDGPHESDETFQIGDSRLDKETAIGAEFSLRKTSGRATGYVNFFANYILDYIYLRIRPGETVTVEGEELDLGRWVQDNALFWGIETKADYALWRQGRHTVGVDGLLGVTIATIPDKNEFVPRIPPLKIGGGVYYKHPNWNARVELIHNFDQARSAPGEFETGGYTLLNASAGYTVKTHYGALDLLVSGTNLLNRRARNASSFLKDSVLLPGRSVRFLVRTRF